MTNKKTTLLVEDEESIIDVIVKKFNKEGIPILVARDGVEGLEMSFKHHPDLILLDIVMPKMDGMTMLKKLREDKWGKDAQVIILTNLGETQQVAESINSGEYDYLVKTNWTLEDVVKKVKEKLKM